MDLNKRKFDITGLINQRFLRKIREKLEQAEDIQLFVSPKVKEQIEKTPVEQRRNELLTQYRKFHFIEFSGALSFPLSFPLTFLTKEQERLLDEVEKKYPKVKDDILILRDAAFIELTYVLLTTDKDLARLIPKLGKLRILNPKDLWQQISITKDSLND